MQNRNDFLTGKFLQWVVACNFLYERNPTKLNDIFGAALLVITFPIFVLRVLIFLLFKR